MGTKKQTRTYATAELREFAKGLRIVAARMDAGLDMLVSDDLSYGWHYRVHTVLKVYDDLVATGDFARLLLNTTP